MKEQILLNAAIGLLAVVFLILTICMLTNIAYPKKVYVADKGDLEALAYKDMRGYYEYRNNIIDAKILECEEAAVSTDPKDFQAHLQEIFSQGEVKLYDKTFRVKMEYYKKLGAKTKMTQNIGTDWFEAACFTRIDGDLLMCSGLVFVNPALPANVAKQILVCEYSTDQTQYWIISAFFGFFALVFMIVLVVMVRRSG